MAVAAAPATPTVERSDTSNLWLRTRRWDLMYITFSVIVVPLPYLVYLLLRAVMQNGAPASEMSQIDDFTRNLVNVFVGVAVGGPHMMSTFLRTGLDNDFKKRYPMLIRSSIIIPIVVVSLAFLNLTLLLTVFFFWAALHVLHQVTFIVELYSHKESQYVRRSAITPMARIIDYAIVLTCLFPMAAYKISQGSFDIGVNDLTSVIPDFFEQSWFFYAMTGVFLAAVVAFLWKSYQEHQAGVLNIPKTTFILFTITIAFILPALPNLDTAFQGLNTWHSFQYLAITFYIIKVRAAYGNLNQTAPLVQRFSRSKDSRGLYLLSTIMLVGSIMVFIVVYTITNYFTPAYIAGADAQTLGNWRFDVSYYTAILSFLWIHYYHDHFLFTDFEALDDAYKTA